MKPRRTKNSSQIKKLFNTHKEILILLLLFFLLQLSIVHSDAVLRWDELVYLANAKSHLETTYFTEDFRFPLLEYLVAALWSVIGESIIVAQVLMILISCAVILLMYVLAQTFLTKQFSLLAAAMLASSKLYVDWAAAVYNDILSVMFILLASYTYYVYTKKTNAWFLVLSGLSTSLAFLARFPAGIIAVILLLVLIKKKDYKGLIYFAAGNAIALVPWMTINIIHYSNPFRDFLAQKHIVDTYTKWQGTRELIMHLIRNTHIFLLAALGGIILFVRTKKKNILLEIMLFILVVQLIYYSFFVNMKLERYVLMMLPMILLLSAYAFEQAYSKLTKPRNHTKKVFRKVVLLVSICVIIIAVTVSYVTMNTNTMCKEQEAFAQSITYAQEHIEEGKLVSSNMWPWYGYYANTKAQSLWTSNVKELIAYEESSSYIITHSTAELQTKLNYSGVHKEIQQEFRDECGTIVTIYKISVLNDE